MGNHHQTPRHQHGVCFFVSLGLDPTHCFSSVGFPLELTKGVSSKRDRPTWNPRKCPHKKTLLHKGWLVVFTSITVEASGFVCKGTLGSGGAPFIPSIQSKQGASKRTHGCDVFKGSRTCHFGWSFCPAQMGFMRIHGPQLPLFIQFFCGRERHLHNLQIPAL